MDTSKVKKILIIKWGALGDIVMATPAIRAFRDNFPDAKITILSNELMKEILPDGFLYDESIVVRTKGNRIDEQIGEQIQLVRELRRHKFDLAVNLRWTSEHCAILAYLSGARQRVGCGPRNMMWLYTINVNAPAGRYHEIHRNLDVAKALGLNTYDETPVVYVSEKNQEFSAVFFSENSLQKSNTICIHPGASRPVRAWMPERFREIAGRIVEHLQARVVVTWGKGEESLAHRVSDGLGKNVIVCEQTNTVGALAAVIKNSRMFFSNCTGPMNVAVAVGTPVVALLGSSDPGDWGAYGKQHVNIKSPLVLDHYSDEDERKAMEMITVETVWGVIQNKWAELTASEPKIGINES
ncbi:MAG TPA: glycosyltransferase family 9 protein [Candidatus Acidoferrales bacterium]|nr:glycosyltransferase family 9 protein [Candidatus Acidoferrales bacterium]